MHISSAADETYWSWIHLEMSILDQITNYSEKKTNLDIKKQKEK